MQPSDPPPRAGAKRGATMTAAVVLFWAAAGLYALACALYCGFLLGLPENITRGARGAMLAAFLVHMCEIGARGVAGLHPVSSIRESIGFAVWITVGVFLVAQLKRRLDAVGAFVAPVAVVLLLFAHLTPSSGGAQTGLGVLGRLHISLATVGVAIFALATGLAVFYLVQERQLKHKRVGLVVKRGLALETLDTMALRLVKVGFPIFTIAMLTGALWVSQRASGLRPEYPIAMVTWTAFAALLIARVTSGWRGRRAAVLTIVGFCAALVVLAIYVARRANGA